MVYSLINLYDSFAIEKWKQNMFFVVAISIHWIKLSIHWIKLLELLNFVSIEWSWAIVITNTPWRQNQNLYRKYHFDAVIGLFRHSKLTRRNLRPIVSSKVFEKLVVYFLSKYDAKICALSFKLHEIHLTWITGRISGIW